jgi:glycosyltransferase involved in cell wall biosynthesis
MFRFVIVGGPAEKYISRCLTSVLLQDFTDWTACVVLDPVGDRTIEIAQGYTYDKRIKLIANSNRMYALPNIITSIAAQSPNSEDVILMLDADDWLSGNNSATIVKRYYDRNPELLLTHGSWVPYPHVPVATNNYPYSLSDWVRGIRNVDWRASHLRTFKYKVWRCVKDEDLRDPCNKYYETAWDLAIMFPMLEMCGPNRVKYISERIYTYNQETPFNDGKVRLREQMITSRYIAAKPAYSYRPYFQ